MKGASNSRALRAPSGATGVEESAAIEGLRGEGAASALARLRETGRA